MSSKFGPPMDKAMTTEQFTQVVDAILQGKYSWACVLILRFAGYNPLHYIPYRTFNRLMKENNRQSNPAQPEKTAAFPQSTASRIRDLGYLESLDNQPCQVRGGAGTLWLKGFGLN